eukprot:UN23636
MDVMCENIREGSILVDFSGSSADDLNEIDSYFETNPMVLDSFGRFWTYDEEVAAVAVRKDDTASSDDAYEKMAWLLFILLIALILLLVLTWNRDKDEKDVAELHTPTEKHPMPLLLVKLKEKARPGTETGTKIIAGVGKNYGKEKVVWEHRPDMNE